MLVAAPLVGLLDVVLSFAIGRDPYNQATGNMADVITTIFILTVYGVLVGALSQMREFVKEREIYKRERLVNLKILPYVLSKVWVAVILAFYQAGAYLIVRYLAFDVPGWSSRANYGLHHPSPGDDCRYDVRPIRLFIVSERQCSPVVRHPVDLASDDLECAL